MSRTPDFDLLDPKVQAAISAMAELAKIALDAERTVEEATVPVYWLLRSGKPEQIGTAVLLRIDDQYFLITAAHVLEPVGSYAVLVGPGDGSPLAQLTGDRFSTAIGPSGSHADDPNDAAVFHITSGIPQQLSTIALSLKHLDLGPTQNTGDAYLVAGFRAKQTKTIGKESRSRRECFPTIEYDSHIYEKRSISLERNLALAWEDKVLINGSWQTSPRPNGMSGGAIIRIVGSMKCIERGEKKSLRPVLSGTVSAQLRESGGKPGTLVGSRIGLHLGLINRYLPDLKLESRLRELT